MTAGEVRLVAEEASAALQNLGPAREALRSLSDESGTLYYAQSDSKWGNEPGPNQFQSRYRYGLWDLGNEFAVLKSRVDAFAKGLDNAIKHFGDVDADAAALQAINEAKLDQRRAENPSRPIGRGLTAE